MHRALTLLKLLMEDESIGVTGAARSLQVNASTAQRLLTTLVADGFAVRLPNRRYALGPALQSTRGSNLGIPLGRRLRPYLEQLFDLTGETVHISTLVGTRIQHLDGIEATAHPLRFGLRVGVWLPAHVTSGGKALLAELTDEEVDRRYQVALAGPRGHRLQVDLDSLHEQLDDVRSSRIAWNFEESEPGLAAIGIATGEIDGQRAALTVALPIARFTRERGERWSANLIEIADRIQQELRASDPHPRVAFFP